MEKLKLLLTPKELRRLWLLIGVLVVKAFSQVIGIASILPFMNLVAKPELVHTNKWLNKIYVAGGFESERSMLIATGIAVLVYMALSNAFVAFVGWAQTKYTMGVAHRMGARMIKSYISEPYEFFLTRSSIDLLKRVVQEVSVFVRQVLSSLLDVIAKGLVSIIILLMLFFVDAVLATTVFLVLGGAYSLIYVLKRKLLQRLGEERVRNNRMRYKSLSDLMVGIKEIQLYQARPYFFERFHAASEYLAGIVPRTHLVTTVPKYMVETLAYGGILLITLYLLGIGGSLEGAVPILSLYAFSGYRLIPALQGAFQSVATMRHGWPVVDEIVQDYNRPSSPLALKPAKPIKRLAFERTLSFHDVTFTYAGEESPALRSISFEIERGSKVAFVGRTGSGKTTLVDVMTGLLAPSFGEVLVDGEPIRGRNKMRWQQQIGYVTQELFLVDDTVARNIAFGIDDDEIDRERMIEAARLAQAHDFIIELLPKGYETIVGDRGVRLSGGQRMRLGLARALYRQPTLLILDEATSALDGITERAIINELVLTQTDLTLIIIAHRLSSVKSCDSIFLLEEGVLSDAGTFSDLLERSDVFSEMRALTS